MYPPAPVRLSPGWSSGSNYSSAHWQSSGEKAAHRLSSSASAVAGLYRSAGLVLVLLTNRPIKKPTPNPTTSACVFLRSSESRSAPLYPIDDRGTRQLAYRQVTKCQQPHQSPPPRFSPTVTSSTGGRSLFVRTSSSCSPWPFVSS